MRWTITIEGTDEFGAAHRSEIALEKDLNSLTAGAVGFSIEDGKTIMAHLQQVIVKQQCETYVLDFAWIASAFGASRTTASERSERCLAASRFVIHAS